MGKAARKAALVQAALVLFSSTIAMPVRQQPMAGGVASPKLVLAARDVLVKPEDKPTLLEVYYPAELHEPTGEAPSPELQARDYDETPEEPVQSEIGFESGDTPEGYETDLYGKVPIDLSFIPLEDLPAPSEEEPQPAPARRSVTKGQPSAEAVQIAQALSNANKVHGVPRKTSPEEVDDMLSHLEARQDEGETDQEKFLKDYEKLDQSGKLQLLNKYMGSKPTASWEFSDAYRIVYGFNPPYKNLNDQTFDFPSGHGIHFSSFDGINANPNIGKIHP